MVARSSEQEEEVSGPVRGPDATSHHTGSSSGGNARRFADASDMTEHGMALTMFQLQGEKSAITAVLAWLLRKL